MLALFMIAALLQSPAYQWPTLSEELKKHGVPVAGIEDAERRITSFAVATDASWFAIAYYWYDSMTHFAPVHPGSVRLYDPETGRDVRLFRRHRDPAGRLTDRSIGTIELMSRSRIRFQVVEEDRVWATDRPGAVPSGPQRTFSVTCDLSPAVPRCRK